jgi:hypothetical protein
MKVDTNKLKQIIQEELCVNVDIQTRQEEYVKAKIIYCKVLRNCGWTLTRIGATISRDHATITHYLKRFDYNFSELQSEDFIIKYKKVNNSFNRYLNKNYLSVMTRSELEQTIEKLLKDEKYI